ncbi:MAG: hypothetical protein QNL90_06805 [Gammaproteobacteria bacterium]|nr:hypothetical protein [Gammaproteobacteria bacterium]MDX2459838.1 hypothetical protein [Gammaproteobacteria bacterium]
MTEQAFPSANGDATTRRLHDAIDNQKGQNRVLSHDDRIAT